MRTQNKKLNVKLLRRIQKHILEEPRRFFMNWVIARQYPGHDTFDSDNRTTQKFAPCGTAACIAGWANLFTKKEPDDFANAAEVIGLDYTETTNSYLFDVPWWPRKFKTAYEKAMDPTKRAKIACARIDYLIKTGK